MSKKDHITSIELFLDRILDRIYQARELYYRLVLIVGPAGSGKTCILSTLSKKMSIPVVNLNLELSARLLKTTGFYKVTHLLDLIEDICAQVQGDMVLLDNTELLFEPMLRNDPLRLLQKLSRKRTLVVSWNGKIERQHLIYATPEHPSFRQYNLKPDEFLLIYLNGESSHEIP